jgi:hypothetical protein
MSPAPVFRCCDAKRLSGHAGALICGALEFWDVGVLRCESIGALCTIEIVVNLIGRLL